MLAGVRPLLLTSKMTDEEQKVGFADDHFVKVKGSFGTVEAEGDNIFMTLSVRNVGQGLALLHGWHVVQQEVNRPAETGPADPAAFRRLTRDLYVPGGDCGFWQGRLRKDDEDFAYVCDRLNTGESITVDILYGDQEGAQRTISRFVMRRRGENPGPDWYATVSRHFYPDRADPR